MRAASLTRGSLGGSALLGGTARATDVLSATSMSRALAYNSSQSASLSRGVKTGHDAGNGNGM